MSYIMPKLGRCIAQNASPDNATQKYLHRVPLNGTGVLERITPETAPAGTHDYEFSPDGQYHLSPSNKYRDDRVFAKQILK